MTRNVALDFYRGIFAILVAIGHWFYWQGEKDLYPRSFILAVNFFFILSGYVLTQQAFYSKNIAEQYFVKFLKSRLFRLYLFIL